MTTEATPQQRIAELLGKTGIPHKQIDVYGRQIVITTWSRNAALKFSTVVAKFATVKRVMESRDDNKVNQNTVLLPSFHKVWRVYGVIE